MSEMTIAERIAAAKAAKIAKHNEPILEAIGGDVWADTIDMAVGEYYALRPVVLPKNDQGMLQVVAASLRPDSLNTVRVDIPGHSRSLVFSNTHPDLIVGQPFNTDDSGALAQLVRETIPAVDSTRCAEHGYVWARMVGGTFKFDCQKCATASGKSSRKSVKREAAPVTVTQVTSPEIEALLRDRAEAVALGEDGADIVADIDAQVEALRAALKAAKAA